MTISERSFPNMAPALLRNRIHLFDRVSDYEESNTSRIFTPTSDQLGTVSSGAKIVVSYVTIPTLMQ